MGWGNNFTQKQGLSLQATSREEYSQKDPKAVLVITLLTNSSKKALCLKARKKRI